MGIDGDDVKHVLLTVFCIRAIVCICVFSMHDFISDL